MSAAKQTQQLARQLFRLSFANGELSAEQVQGVLQYIEKHCAHPHAILTAYHRLVAAEVARGRAVIEHAGPVNPASVAEIAATLGKKYGRRIEPVPQRNDTLLAGVRVRIGDDVYESSVAGHLSNLAAST